MKIFFDTNVYIVEALLGRAAQRMIIATSSAHCRSYCSDHVLHEVQTVTLRLGFTARLATLSQDRIGRPSVAIINKPSSRHAVKKDPLDSQSFEQRLRAARIIW